MSKTHKAPKQEQKEGTLRSAIVDGRIVFYSDPRISRPIKRNNTNTNKSGKPKPRIVFA